ncbi:hypothetical protein [Anianabacter salinae]|uniref:hypothetical protein n=1 Tax=Anianabacter salinae TaxID=2851023 RepID=UPI00225DE557|nr:hypothetical protein [Anianabacter salinae]MBV0912026.1 hypothetical protein [Anianabacter salinae]
MEWLVWIGTALSLAGLAGLVWCIVSVARAKRQGLSDEAMRAKLQRIVPANLGALAVSAIGLMCVVMGIALA